MQASQEPSHQRLLSARQVQTLLHVDRSTVYRMADDGRLPAIRVGRQWRFPEHRITAFLDRSADAGAVLPGEDGLDVRTATAVARVAADLLGVMTVVTDMDAHPLTPVANPCPWFAERADDDGLLLACTAEWQALADAVDLEPRFATGALGFQCARAFVRSGDRLVGMVLVGGVAPPGTAAPGLFHLGDDDRRAVLAALPKVAAALSSVTPRSVGPLETGSVNPLQTRSPR